MANLADSVISIHAPRVGSDFLTLTYDDEHLNFNPRSPCGERPGSDIYVVRKLVKFQSTLPVWGATYSVERETVDRYISIHAPRVGSDTGINIVSADVIQDFNPRSPCGERQNRRGRKVIMHIFQSTLPVWGAT